MSARSNPGPPVSAALAAAAPTGRSSLRTSWIVTALIFLFLLGGCSVMAGNFEHWPASLLAIAVLIPVKILNDRFKVLSWPMEFILLAGVTMIVFNLVRLYFVELPY